MAVLEKPTCWYEAYVDSHYTQLLLIDYFSSHNSSDTIIQKISKISFLNWLAFAGSIKAMLWLDVKRYIEDNIASIKRLIQKKGKGWLLFMPKDISGLVCSNKIFAEEMTDIIPNNNKEDFQSTILEFKKSYTSLSIDYKSTDYFLQLSKPPTVSPIHDEEWTAFGYSLFWLKKRGIELEQNLSKEQLLKGINSGDAQSRANAIRGLFEQNNYRDYYNEAKDIMLTRLIEEYCVINFNVTEDDVCCKFVPPIFYSDSANNSTDTNSNHYWKIRFLNLLQQIFPDKEYIEIELLGVDFLSDLGIKPIDHKVRIPKKNRHDIWITEINSWGKSRIDYYYRPDSWVEYVKQVDDTRTIANHFIKDLIKCLDSLYKKRFLNDGSWQKVMADISDFNNIQFLDKLLPKPAVDPYCLFREDMQPEFKSEIFKTTAPVQQLLSYSMYSKFQQSYAKAYSGLENYINQFASVLLARVKNEPLNTNINSNLPLINLFSSAKEFTIFANQYQELFSNYSTLDSGFLNQEIENMLVLLNMWCHITKLPPQGYTIAYNAKLKLKRTEQYIENGIIKFITQVGGKSVVIDKQQFLLIEYDQLANDSIENEFSKTVLKLRKVLTEAIPFGSERHYIEVQHSSLVYVPMFTGRPISSGFSIPIYKLLDGHTDAISSTLFPVELPESLYQFLNIENKAFFSLNKIIAEIASIQIIFTQYNTILRSADNTIPNNGLDHYINMFISAFTTIHEEIVNDIALPVELLKDLPDETSEDHLKSITHFLKLIDYAEKQVQNRCLIDDMIEVVAKEVLSAMLMLQLIIA